MLCEIRIHVHVERASVMGLNPTQGRRKMSCLRKDSQQHFSFQADPELLSQLSWLGRIAHIHIHVHVTLSYVYLHVNLVLRVHVHAYIYIYIYKV